jgi:hypothetical protein
MSMSHGMYVVCRTCTYTVCHMVRMWYVVRVCMWYVVRVRMQCVIWYVCSVSYGTYAVCHMVRMCVSYDGDMVCQCNVYEPIGVAATSADTCYVCEAEHHVT